MLSRFKECSASELKIPERKVHNHYKDTKRKAYIYIYSLCSQSVSETVWIKGSLNVHVLCSLPMCGDYKAV